MFNYTYFSCKSFYMNLSPLLYEANLGETKVINKSLGQEFSENSMIYWRRQWHPTPVLLPGKSHGWRSLVGCSPWGRKESDMTKRLHFHFFHALEKEMATHPSVLAWRIPGMAEPGGLPSMGSHSQTWLKRLSSSSSIYFIIFPLFSSLLFSFVFSCFL